ncbi:hypothetical protein CIL03_02790 [Virgibacillus indicus]|uniref:Uncharacterized protein n=1 Tax=Virgibacillus indicus TaxID=2024554 RepID=A0A265NDL1_9BACI|nr:hypothetical protein [Virgibacillus indicus]OZU90083.1 hypothetical protein CIL03_02790 [Virgibacillus indicus]
MENKTEQHEDQAAELRKLLDEVQQGEKEAAVKKPVESHDEAEQQRDIDILNLPPRKEVHGNTRNMTHIKISLPLIRFLAVILILLIIVMGAYYFYGEEINELFLNN